MPRHVADAKTWVGMIILIENTSRQLIWLLLISWIKSYFFEGTKKRANQGGGVSRDWERSRQGLSITYQRPGGAWRSKDC